MYPPLEIQECWRRNLIIAGLGDGSAFAAQNFRRLDPQN
jgi:hypothetical protein